MRNIPIMPERCCAAEWDQIRDQRKRNIFMPKAACFIWHFL